MNKNTGNTTKSEYTCIKCGKVFSELPGKYASGKFCSKKCARDYSRDASFGKTKSIHCFWCGKTICVDSRASAKTLCDSCKKISKKCSSIRTRNKNMSHIAETYSVNQDSETDIKSEAKCRITHKDCVFPQKKQAILANQLKKNGMLPEWLIVDKLGRLTVDDKKLEEQRCENVRGSTIFRPVRLAKSSGYLYCVVEDHPMSIEHGYVLLHDVIIENLIGRVLDRDNEVVHHIDRNRFNNNPSNLRLMTKSEHSREHQKIQKDESIYDLYSCPWCKTLFAKKKCSADSKKFCVSCSKSCRAKLAARIKNNTVDDDLSSNIKNNFIKSSPLKILLSENTDLVVK